MSSAANASLCNIRERQQCNLLSSPATALWHPQAAENVLEKNQLQQSIHEIVAQGDVHQQIRLLRHADVEDFEISVLVARTREHHLDFG